MSSKQKNKQEKSLKINYYSSKNSNSNQNYSIDQFTDRLYYETFRYNSLPKHEIKKSIRICVLSDTHDEHFVLGILPKCDILIHAGDILMKSRKLTIEQAVNKLIHFNDWIGSQEATYKIVIGGNHDQLLQNLDASSLFNIFTKCSYLCNTSKEVHLPHISRPLIITGLPVSLGASTNEAFQTSEFILQTQEYISKHLSPHSVDILITHGPCMDIGQHVSPNILHVFGHQHEDYGVYKRIKPVKRRKRSRSRSESREREEFKIHPTPQQVPENRNQVSSSQHKHTSSSTHATDNNTRNTHITTQQHNITQRTRRYEARSRSRETHSTNNTYSCPAVHETNNKKHTIMTNNDDYYVLAAPIMDDCYHAIQLPLMFNIIFEKYQPRVVILMT